MNDMIAMILDTFSFLINEFEFRLLQSISNNYGIRIYYKNTTTGVEVNWEVREQRIFIMIIRLIDGEIPEYPIFFTSDSESYYYDLGDVMKVKNGSFFDYGNLNNNDIESVLVNSAEYLKQYSQDLLNGNFDIVPHIETIINGRAERFMK